MVFGIKLVSCAVMLSMALTACVSGGQSAGSARVKNPENLDLQRLLVMPNPPEVAAADTADMARTARLLRTLDPNRLAERDGARLIDANALPWLTQSTEGRAFLANRPGRVLVRGKPSTFCPAALARSGTGSVVELAIKTLEDCLGQSAPGCGCQVVAAGSVLLVPRRDMAYATGISARIRARSLGLDGFLVAEETKGGTILLRDVSGVIGRLTRSDDGTITITLARDEGIFTGRARPVGFRRGRLAERIYAKDENGRRLSLLIGFEPGELAEIAGAWLAWPPDA